MRIAHRLLEARPGLTALLDRPWSHRATVAAKPLADVLDRQPHFLLTPGSHMGARTLVPLTTGADELLVTDPHIEKSIMSVLRAADEVESQAGLRGLSFSNGDAGMQANVTLSQFEGGNRWYVREVDAVNALSPAAAEQRLTRLLNRSLGSAEADNPGGWMDLGLETSTYWKRIAREPTSPQAKWKAGQVADIVSHELEHTAHGIPPRELPNDLPINLFQRLDEARAELASELGGAETLRRALGIESGFQTKPFPAYRREVAQLDGLLAELGLLTATQDGAAGARALVHQPTVALADQLAREVPTVVGATRSQRLKDVLDRFRLLNE